MNRSLSRLGFTPYFLVPCAVLMAALACIAVWSFLVAFGFTPSTANFASDGTGPGFLDAGLWAQLRRIVTRAAGVATCATIASALLAFWLRYRASSTARVLAFAILVCSLVVGDALRSFGWSRVLAPDSMLCGLVSEIVGKPITGFSLRYNWWAPWIGLGSGTLPIGAFTILAALPTRGSNLWKVCDELDRSVWKRFYTITIRGAWHAIVIAWVLGFIVASSASSESRFLEGPTQISMFSLVSSLMSSNPKGIFYFCFIICMVGCAMSALVMHVWARQGALRPERRGSFFNWIAASWKFVSSRLVGSQERHSRSTDRWGRLLLDGCAVCVLVFLAIPTVAVICDGFVESRGARTQYGLGNYALAFESPVVREAFRNSVEAAVVASGFSIMLALGLGTVVFSMRGRWLVCLCGLGAVIPGDVVAVVVRSLLKAVGADTSGVALVGVVLAFWMLPFVLAGVIVAFAKIEKVSIMSAVEMDKRVGVVLWRAVLGGCVLVVIELAVLSGLMAISEFPRTFYLGGPGRFVGPEIYGRLASGFIPGDRGIVGLVSAIGIAVAIMSGICGRWIENADRAN